MAKPLVSDGLQTVVAPLLPQHRPRAPRKPGWRRVPDRALVPADAPAAALSAAPVP